MSPPYRCANSSHAKNSSPISVTFVKHFHDAISLYKSWPRTGEVEKQFATPISRTVKSAIHKCNLKRRLRANRGRRPPGARKQFGILSAVPCLRGGRDTLPLIYARTLGSRWANAQTAHTLARPLPLIPSFTTCKYTLVPQSHLYFKNEGFLIFFSKPPQQSVQASLCINSRINIVSLKVQVKRHGYSEVI